MEIASHFLGSAGSFPVFYLSNCAARSSLRIVCLLMSADAFFLFFEPIRSLSNYSKVLSKMNRHEIFEVILDAVKTLKAYEKTMISQSNTLLKSTKELLKQGMRIRSLETKSEGASANENYNKDKQQPSTYITDF